MCTLNVLISVYLFVFGEHWKFNKSWTVCIHHQRVETVGCDKVCFLWVELSGRVKPGGDSWNIHAVCILWAVHWQSWDSGEKSLLDRAHWGSWDSGKSLLDCAHWGNWDMGRVF